MEEVIFELAFFRINVTLGVGSKDNPGTGSSISEMLNQEDAGRIYQEQGFVLGVGGKSGTSFNAILET
jgi:hypothetical protein